jgi:hypothetical protein
MVAGSPPMGCSASLISCARARAVTFLVCVAPAEDGARAQLSRHRAAQGRAWTAPPASRRRAPRKPQDREHRRLISRRIGSTGINYTADKVELGELVLIERRPGADGLEAARPCRHLRIEHPVRRCRVREADSGKPQAHIMFGGGLCEEQLKFNEIGLA